MKKKFEKFQIVLVLKISGKFQRNFSEISSVVITGKQFAEKCTSFEPWFGTGFGMEDISQDLISKLSGSKNTNPNLFMPNKNLFIPDSLQIKKCVAVRIMT
jgi:hypothetical protein